MATPQREAGAFDPTIESVPQTEQIVQRFGWLYGYFGVLALAVFAGMTYGLWKDLRGQVQLIGLLIGLALGGPVLLWWEFRRRKARTVLVRRGDVLGIYRRGQFVQTMRPDEMMIRKPNRAKMLRAVILLPLCAAVFLGVPLFDRDYWPWAIIGIIFLIGLIPGAQAWLKMERCVIPGGRFPQELLLDKGDLQRLVSS